MQDRFKFRVFHNGKYMEEDDVVLETSGIVWETSGNTIYGLLSDYDNTGVIIEQCTGLKDFEQNDIYEGDVLEFDLSTPKNGGHYKGVVVWSNSNESIGWMIEDLKDGGQWDLRQIAHPNDWMVWGKIIGNINENPELFEK